MSAPCCEWENSGHAKACSEYPAPTRPPLPNPTAAGPPSDPKLDEPWRRVTSTDMLEWWTRHPEMACSEKTARALYWLEITFSSPSLALE